MKGITLGIILLIVGIIIGFGITQITTQNTTTATNNQETSAMEESTTEIPIGVMVSLSGDLASYGPLYREAALIAEEHVNNYLSSIGSNYRVKLYIEDDRSTPEGALSAAQTFAAKGIHIIFTYTSSATASVMDFAQQNNMIVISYASTAPQLAIPDNVFRLIPNDLGQSQAIVKLLEHEGITRLAIIYRGDDWGDGLYEAIKERFEADGGQVIASIRYDPSSRELSAEVHRLSDAIQEAGVSEDLAILALSFPGDFISIFNIAKDDPVLMSVRWVGSDGTVGDTKIRDVFGQTIVDEGIQFINTRFTVQSNPLQAAFNQDYMERTGEQPLADTYALYDGIWAITLTVVQTTTDSGETLTAAFPLIAQHFYGLTGWLQLDENGDRASATYAYMMLVPTENGTIEWRDVGYYDASSDTVTLNLP